MGELDDNGATAELVARVAAVPVVVAGIAVDEGVPAPRNTLYHPRIALDRRHVLVGNLVGGWMDG